MSPPPSPKVRVIIVAFQSGAFLQRCVDALSAQEGVAWECVVVDNGSTDGSVDALRVDARFTTLRAGTNLGFAAANNLGARGAETEWLALLNPDAFPRPGWLKALVEGAQEAGVDMAGGTQVFAGDPARLDGLGDGYSAYGLAWRMGFGHPVEDIPAAPYPVFGPCAAAALYRRRLWERVGGMDARFFCYHEDVDLALRMRRAGAQCVQVPGAVVDHVSSGIAGRASDFAVFHGTRNRMWTFAKSMPLSGLVLLGPLHALTTLAMMGWSLFRPGRARPTWRGVGAGLRGLPEMLRSRGEVPGEVGLAGLLPALTWNPATVVRRRLARARERL